VTWPRLWKGTAAASALLFCLLLVGASRGSIHVIERAPRGGQLGSPSWTRGCTLGNVREDRQRLAYCARVEGHVVASSHGPNADEAHLAVVSDFHLVIVRLPPGAATPGWGSNVVAVGPLLRARNGQREVQAFVVRRS
jgi:hypothetical protein